MKTIFLVSLILCIAGTASAATYTNVETWTLANGWTISADKYRCFPTPLLYIPACNYAELIISATTLPDTLWYQLIRTNSLMDTLAVWGAPEPLVSADLNHEACEYIPWPVTGKCFVLEDFGVSKFFGVRIATSAAQGVTNLKITLTTATKAD